MVTVNNHSWHTVLTACSNIAITTSLYRKSEAATLQTNSRWITSKPTNNPPVQYVRYIPPSRTTESPVTPIIAPTVVFCILFLLATGYTAATVLVLCWKSRQARRTLKEASQYATVYFSHGFYDSADVKVQRNGSMENIYDSVDEVSIRALEDITGESCDMEGVPQGIKLTFDATGVTKDTTSEPLDEIGAPLEADSSESGYQEITHPSVQNGTYAHLYSTLPLHQGARADPQYQNAVDVTETKLDREEETAKSDEGGMVQAHTGEDLA